MNGWIACFLNTFLRFQIQESFGAHYDLVEMKLPEICPGSPEYQENIKFLKTTIAQLKTPEGAKAMQVINNKMINVLRNFKSQFISGFIFLLKKDILSLFIETR